MRNRASYYRHRQRVQFEADGCPMTVSPRAQQPLCRYSPAIRREEASGSAGTRGEDGRASVPRTGGGGDQWADRGSGHGPETWGWLADKRPRIGTTDIAGRDRAASVAMWLAGREIGLGAGQRGGGRNSKPGNATAATWCARSWHRRGTGGPPPDGGRRRRGCKRRPVCKNVSHSTDACDRSKLSGIAGGWSVHPIRTRPSFRTPPALFARCSFGQWNVCGALRAPPVLVSWVCCGS